VFSGMLVGLGEGTGLVVGVAVAVAVADEMGVGLTPGDGLAVGVGVGVALALGLGVPLALGLAVGVALDVATGDTVGTAVAPRLVRIGATGGVVLELQPAKEAPPSAKRAIPRQSFRISIERPRTAVLETRAPAEISAQRVG